MRDEESVRVEAIFEGRIVRVPEAYALREGLPIVRRPEQKFRTEEKKNKEEEERRLLMDDFRKPLSWKTNKVAKELIDNFHWEIVRERRRRNLSRKELALGIGVSENTVKILENGILPKDDFVLINKLQDFLGVNLRRERGNFGEMRKLIESERKEEEAGGEDIEIIEDDS